jgi:hypothetical protein
MSLVPLAPFCLRQLCERKSLRTSFEKVPPESDLLCFAPDDILVVTTIDQCVDFGGGSVTKENPTFDTFAEKNL